MARCTKIAITKMTNMGPKMAPIRSVVVNSLKERTIGATRCSFKVCGSLGARRGEGSPEDGKRRDLLPNISTLCHPEENVAWIAVGSCAPSQVSATWSLSLLPLLGCKSLSAWCSRCAPEAWSNASMACAVRDRSMSGSNCVFETSSSLPTSSAMMAAPETPRCAITQRPRWSSRSSGPGTSF